MASPNDTTVDVTVRDRKRVLVVEFSGMLTSDARKRLADECEQASGADEVLMVPAGTKVAWL